MGPVHRAYIIYTELVVCLVVKLVITTSIHALIRGIIKLGLVMLPVGWPPAQPTSPL